jgi:choline kinase
MIILPIAGKSSRFKKVGVNQPKWTLEVGKQYILNRAIESIIDSRNAGEEIVMGCLSEQLDSLSQILSPEMQSNVTIVTLDHETNGQAESVLRIIEKIRVDPQDRLIVWCGDSAFNVRAFNFKSKTGSWILVSNLPGEHWSFVRESADGVIEVAEKLRISDHASLGLYAFDTVQDFLDTSPLEIHKGYKESFIAPLYNTLIGKKKRVEMYQIAADDFYPLGTPREILETAHRMKWDPPAELLDLSL